MSDPYELSYPRLEEFRRLLGVSMDDFCKLIGVDLGTYIKWVMGSEEPSLEDQRFLARFYRIVKENGLLLPDRV